MQNFVKVRERWLLFKKCCRSISLYAGNNKHSIKEAAEYIVSLSSFFFLSHCHCHCIDWSLCVFWALLNFFPLSVLLTFSQLPPLYPISLCSYLLLSGCLPSHSIQRILLSANYRPHSKLSEKELNIFWCLVRLMTTLPNFSEVYQLFTAQKC